MKYSIFFSTLIFLCSCSSHQNDKGTNSHIKTDSSVTVADTNNPLSNPEAVTLEEKKVEVPGIAFAFCNKEGTQLLALTDSLTDPSSYTKTISDKGEIIGISFKEKRKADKDDNHRQNHYNFNKSGGYLFETASDKVSSEYSNVLFTEEFLKTRKFISVQANTVQTLPAADKKRIESQKKKKIKSFKNISQIDKDRIIYLIEFERKKDSCLVSLAFVTKDKIVYLDFPAKFDEISTWRVDDGGEFGLDYYRIIGLFEHNGVLEMITDWVGAEGYSVFLLKEAGTKFEEQNTGYRYSTPL